MEYYKAYDERYRQIHALGLPWASENATPLLGEVMARYGIGKNSHILELGCGEGRDALPLLRAGYDLTACDVSGEAVRWCRERCPEKPDAFRVLDVCAEELADRFDFIFAAAVLHMLTEDADRDAFWRFLRRHLKENGLALVLSMGDGEREFCSDAQCAFKTAERTHQGSGRRVEVAATTCRMVSARTMHAEALRGGLAIVEEGRTAIPGEFDEMIYLVGKAEEPHD